MDRQADGLTDGIIIVHQCIDGNNDGWKDRGIDGWMDKRMNGRIDGQTDERKDRWTDVGTLYHAVLV